MEIHQAAIEDVKAVSHLFNLYRIFYQQPSDLQAAEEFIKARVDNKDSVIFVVKEQGEYIGFTQLYPTFSSVHTGKVWILNDLFVHETARNRGIGELLLNKAKEHAVETGAVSLSLSTAYDNDSAQRLYEKNGYKKDTQFYHYELNITE